MKIRKTLALALPFLFGCSGRAQDRTPVEPPVSFYSLSATDIDGGKVDMSRFKGKVVMVVNTASKCGYTPQYADLQALYAKYGGDHFVIIGFPSNDFMHQEPGTEAEIAAFCEKNYGVTFPMMSKIDVKGRGMHPVYQWLTREDQNGLMDNKVSWNFNKFLIDAQGRLVGHWGSSTKPDDPEIVKYITAR
ncbi:MAG: glutathione peroxidase [Flavobacteriales bacterium]|nr:glutathione peroxidase [Flavobacteriales bacterium]MCB9168108.1 glutathione peroxidase [Flavobacteriales bacterium]